MQSLDSISEMRYNYGVLEMNYQTFRTRFEPFACFSNEQVSASFPGFDRGNYQEWLKKGYLKRLRRGWYAFADAARIPGIGDYFAGKIYAPSYLSCQYVMARVGLIPESVVQYTSVTSLKTASFVNDFGEYFYQTVRPQLMFGYESESVGNGLPVFVARPVKALCDYLYPNPHYDSPEELEELRLDEDVLADILVEEDELRETVERFDNGALERRVELLRKVYGI